MENFMVNGRRVKAKEIDFNFVCMLGENGIELDDISKKALSSLRYYVAWCMNVSPDIAGNEINLHVVNGGTLQDLFAAFNEAFEDSGFFRSFRKEETAEETTAEDTKKSSKKNQKDEGTAE